jgi:hypothetical protein
MSDEISGFRCLLPDIMFWEEASDLRSETTMTLTVGCKSLPDLAAVLTGVFCSFRSVVRWHSALHGEWANRVQERRVKKIFSEDPPGFEHTHMLKLGDVFTNASSFSPPLSLTHLECLLDYRATVLIVALHGDLTPPEVCDLMSGSAQEVSETTIGSVRTARPDLLVCRVVSHDCDVSRIQLFGSKDLREGPWRSVESLEHLGSLDDFGAWNASLRES